MIQNMEYLEMKLETQKELDELIEKNIKVSGFEHITDEKTKRLPRKLSKKIVHIINAAHRLKHVPNV